MKQDSKQEYKQVDKFIVTSTLLGKGSFGVVYRGFFKDDHSKIVAAKVIPIDRISQDPKFLELLKREIDIMQKIEHPNIVRMYAATRTSRNLYMFLEYCRDGDLKDLLKKNGGVLSESEAVVYFRQIVEGFKVR
jgi:serine/threonine protein kinase